MDVNLQRRFICRNAAVQMQMMFVWPTSASHLPILYSVTNLAKPTVEHVREALWGKE